MMTLGAAPNPPKLAPKLALLRQEGPSLGAADSVHPELSRAQYSAGALRSLLCDVVSPPRPLPFSPKLEPVKEEPPEAEAERQRESATSAVPCRLNSFCWEELDFEDEDDGGDDGGDDGAWRASDDDDDGDDDRHSPLPPRPELDLFSEDACYPMPLDPMEGWAA